MDFMRDPLGDGRSVPTFNVIADGSREAPVIEVDFSLLAERVVRAREQIAEERGVPQEIVVDNGPEFVSKVLDLWAPQRGVTLCFIRPGKPVENCFVESFNGTFRKDCLDAHWFEDFGHARRVIESWLLDYSNDRPHSGSETSRRRSLRPSGDLRLPPVRKLRRAAPIENSTWTVSLQAVWKRGGAQPAPQRRPV